MFNISNYLKKISKKIDSSDDLKKTIIDIIEREVGIKIDFENIEIKDYYLNINSNQAVKNKLFIYKDRIIKEIKEKTNQTISGIK
jgi:hypothetical protein